MELQPGPMELGRQLELGVLNLLSRARRALPASALAREPWQFSVGPVGLACSQAGRWPAPRWARSASKSGASPRSRQWS